MKLYRFRVEINETEIKVQKFNEVKIQLLCFSAYEFLAKLKQLI